MMRKQTAQWEDDQNSAHIPHKRKHKHGKSSDHTAGKGRWLLTSTASSGTAGPSIQAGDGTEPALPSDPYTERGRWDPLALPHGWRVLTECTVKEQGADTEDHWDTDTAASAKGKRTKWIPRKAQYSTHGGGRESSQGTLRRTWG